MGRRKVDIENAENKSPHQVSNSGTNKSVLVMQTRSSKPSSSSSAVGNIELSKSGCINEEYPASALIQTIATSISSDTEKPHTSHTSTAPGPSRSPLAESSCNEQTPEKSTDPEYVSRLVDAAGDSGVTPTTNLKILCEVADKNESVSSSDEILEIQVLNPSSNARRLTAEPVTPTANLKMLITAASPEIRSLELSKSRLFADDEDDEDDMDDNMDDLDSQSSGNTSRKKGKADAKGGSISARKQKSLGILCRRFMAQFDEFPPPTSRIEVCLDELAAHLGTERRRIYDIVNVLESVEMMSRRAKNRYLWHGKTNLNATLVKLKYYAETEQVAKQLELVRELEITRLYGRKSKTNGALQTEEEAVSSHPKYKEYIELFGENHRRERSLGVMSQKFLMLFLTGRTKTINLDMAAKLLLGDPMVQTKQTNSQFKTKIRRLYDIANILASLNLICKVHVTELRGRKPAFCYIGPDVEELAALDEYKYLKEVEVTRPGRTTLDMKMEELKRKMEAHIAAEKEANQVKQVPPVTMQGPDLEKLKEELATSRASLSHVAGEYVAKKKPDKERLIKPKSPANRPFVILQGPGTVITTSKAPQFMNDPSPSAGSCAISTANTLVSSGQEVLTILPFQRTIDGNQIVLATATTPAFTKSPASSSTILTTNKVTRKILPLPSSRSPISSTTTSPQAGSSILSPQIYGTQLKRPLAATVAASDSYISSSQESSILDESEGSTFFITKGDNEYYLVNKRPRIAEESGGDDTSEAVKVDLQEHTEPSLSQGSISSIGSESQQTIQVLHTPITNHMSGALPIVYSTPHSGGHITLIASPFGTPVSNASPATAITQPSNVKNTQPVVAGLMPEPF